MLNRVTSGFLLDKHFQTWIVYLSCVPQRVGRVVGESPNIIMGNPESWAKSNSHSTDNFIVSKV